MQLKSEQKSKKTYVRIRKQAKRNYSAEQGSGNYVFQIHLCENNVTLSPLYL